MRLFKVEPRGKTQSLFHQQPIANGSLEARKPIMFFMYIALKEVSDLQECKKLS